MISSNSLLHCPLKVMSRMTQVTETLHAAKWGQTVHKGFSIEVFQFPNNPALPLRLMDQIRGEPKISCSSPWTSSSVWNCVEQKPGLFVDSFTPSPRTWFQAPLGQTTPCVPIGECAGAPICSNFFQLKPKPTKEKHGKPNNRKRIRKPQNDWMTESDILKCIHWNSRWDDRHPKNRDSKRNKTEVQDNTSGQTLPQQREDKGERKNAGAKRGTAKPKQRQQDDNRTGEHRRNRRGRGPGQSPQGETNQTAPPPPKRHVPQTVT